MRENENSGKSGIEKLYFLSQTHYSIAVITLIKISLAYNISRKIETVQSLLYLLTKLQMQGTVALQKASTMRGS